MAPSRKIPRARLVKNTREQIVGARRHSDANERKQIGRGNHAALLLGLWAMLDQRAERHRKQSAEETEQSQIKNSKTSPRHTYR